MKTLEDMLRRTYECDCEALAACISNGKAYEMCRKGYSYLKDERCSIETQKLLMQQHSQVPSKTSRVVLAIERTTLWIIAVMGLIIALFALFNNEQNQLDGFIDEYTAGQYDCYNGQSHGSTLGDTSNSVE